MVTGRATRIRGGHAMPERRHRTVHGVPRTWSEPPGHGPAPPPTGANPSSDTPGTKETSPASSAIESTRRGAPRWPEARETATRSSPSTTNRPEAKRCHYDNSYSDRPSRRTAIAIVSTTPVNPLLGYEAQLVVRPGQPPRARCVDLRIHGSRRHHAPRRREGPPNSRRWRENFGTYFANNRGSGWPYEVTGDLKTLAMTQRSRLKKAIPGQMFRTFLSLRRAEPSPGG
jgi:hypothetical protein